MTRRARDECCTVLMVPGACLDAAYVMACTRADNDRHANPIQPMTAFMQAVQSRFSFAMVAWHVVAEKLVLFVLQLMTTTRVTPK